MVGAVKEYGCPDWFNSLSLESSQSAKNINGESTSKREAVEELFSLEGRALMTKHEMASTSKEIVGGSSGSEGGEK